MIIAATLIQSAGELFYLINEDVKSTPFAELKETRHGILSVTLKNSRKKKLKAGMSLVASWGSTLSLSYAITHPKRAKSLILRGIFLLRKKNQWFYQEGASRIFPDAWDRYWNAIDPEKRHDMVKAYYDVLTGDDREKNLRLREPGQCGSEYIKTRSGS